MGIMSFLRNRAGILIGAIGFAIVAFLVSDVVRRGTPFWKQNENKVGVVAGEAISIEDFNQKVETNTASFKQQMGQNNLNPQMNAYIIENTWNQSVSQILLTKELDRLGIKVSPNEMTDMVNGKNPDPQIVQNFGDPKTGQLNRMQLNQFLTSIKTQGANSELSTRWTEFLKGLRQAKMVQKYNTLVKNSLYVTSLEAREDYSQRNKLANFKYVNLEYSSIPDAQIKLTDEDYTAYYNENKYKFKKEEDTRSFEYVVFDANPSKEDSAAVKSQVDKLVAELRVSKNDSLFVSINSDTKTPVTYKKKGSLEPALDSLIFSSASGQVVGPVFSNGSYKFAKVIDVKLSPDSVKARHILINPATEGGIDKAKAKADSIKNLIQKGASFAELASKFGTDGSKDKGGELGTFARGSMIPAFEEAVFGGKTGDLLVLTTQYGVHIIKIDAQIGSSRVAKVAMVDKALTSSVKTQQEAYSKATSFLSVAKDSKSFDDEAQKAGFRKLVAEDITGSQSTIPGLENPRPLIRWVYKADVNDISEEVFETDNKYVVAKVTSVTAKGFAPLEKVKKQIEPLVLNKAKAKLLLDKASKALEGSSTIEQVSQKLKKATVPVQNIVFANPIIPGIAQENKVVGTVFGSQPKKLSRAIEGENGIYVFSVDSFTNPAPLANAYKQKEQIIQSLVQRAASETFKVLRDKAEIKDNRVKFF